MVEGRSDVDGRFTGIRRIGPSGGGGYFSLMFSALDGETGRRVALKFFHPEKRGDPYRLECFEREAAILARLKGQRRVTSLVAPRSSVDEQLPTTVRLPFYLRFEYFALELAATDMQVVIEEGKWDAERRLVAFRGMCRAVARVHELGVAHRDLKPGNFLVMRRGSIKLSDFGAARRFDIDAQALRPAYGVPVGDVRYTAPEMLASLHDADPTIAFAADIYSLGAILFELFSGQVLGLHLFSDPGYLQGLISISQVRADQRIRIYDQLLPAVTNRTLPSVSDFDRLAPDAVLERVDALYRSMAALDYHQDTRLRHFGRIFQQIDACLLVLRNHQKYMRWEHDRARREAWRQAKVQRQSRQFAAATTQGGST